MDQTNVLDVMKRYFQDRHPADVMARFAELKPKELLPESLDVVDFVVYLEEELGREIDATRVSEAFAAESFEELAAGMARLMSAAG